ncbi:MAG: DUF2442 domain-containing protein [Atopobiaceae bacterium]|jgi:hypothetical protein|nr:DUF2442 domain-containing protein [Atopobiaceae bacterium]
MPKFRSFKATVSAEAIDSCHVKASFEDGAAAILGFSDIIGRGPWEKLADPGFFKRAYTACGTIVWSDDVDLAPEDVWGRAQNASLGTTCQGRGRTLPEGPSSSQGSA